MDLASWKAPCFQLFHALEHFYGNNAVTWCKDTAELRFLMKLGCYESCLQSPAGEEGQVPSEEASARW